MIGGNTKYWQELRFDLLAASLLTTVVALESEAALAEPPQPKPNVVVIMTDDIGWGDLGSYDGGAMCGATTPDIDRLAAEGMRFVNHYQRASCTAGRASKIPALYDLWWDPGDLWWDPGETYDIVFNGQRRRPGNSRRRQATIRARTTAESDSTSRRSRTLLWAELKTRPNIPYKALRRGKLPHHPRRNTDRSAPCRFIA